MLAFLGQIALRSKKISRELKQRVRKQNETLDEKQFAFLTNKI